ncbi:MULTISPECIES: Sll0314/Alr1548 family TPR repeat-containing protein [unclassified Microcoleus]|uniref:Sll0314/Alr1548 family TPR repeat-containing protein n=1 Tax=unclassified Microcoleus TaxID=2642155 RepID=UPI0025F8959B|nr:MULTISPECIES: Sll0314/Alr1548 family TPR repeat-containing protein [unclassified Microcoleus]
MTKNPLASLGKQMLSYKQTVRAIACGSAIALGICINSAVAGDPFRTLHQQAIGSNTETAFKTMFQQGNYKQAKAQIQQALSAEPNEPLAYAMAASLSYIEQDLNSMNTYAQKTREVGEKLTKTNPLRGNIYTAAGHFLEGANAIAKEGTAKGAPQALNKLRVVFQYLDAAEKIAPNDPELNLLKGYMDLMLASNLPFSNPSDAIKRLEEKASPRYLAYRGMAVGYRDLKKYDRALEFANKSLAETPTNPEILYLKAQVLSAQAKTQSNNKTILEEARKNFDAALAKPDQLPRSLVAEIFFQQCKTRNRLDSKSRDCDPMRDKIRDADGVWGPTALPPL